MTERPMIERAVPLIDLEILRTGDGRTVTAYAATFDDPYEVSDHMGHYVETINRAAFNRVIGRGFSNVKVLFNHGLSIWGTPSEKNGDPIAVPVALRAEPRGLLTTSRFGTTERAEEVLTMLRDGIVTHYSFRGPIVRSAPSRRSASGLQLIERTELGLTEYGPGIIAVNKGAELVAIRSTAMILEEVEQMTAEERAELLAKLSPPTVDPEISDPQEHPAEPSASDPDPSTHHILIAEAELLLERLRELDS